MKHTALAFALLALLTSTTAHAVVRDPINAECPEGTVKREFFAGFVTDKNGRIKTDDVGTMRIHIDVKCRGILRPYEPPPQPETYYE